MTRHSASITALPRSPADDRRRRMIQYTIANGLRVVCVLLVLFVDGWWRVPLIAGAVVLPWIAVMIANAKDTRANAVLRPGAIVRVERPGADRSDSERRGAGGTDPDGPDVNREPSQ